MAASETHKIGPFLVYRIRDPAVQRLIQVAGGMPIFGFAIGLSIRASFPLALLRELKNLGVRIVALERRGLPDRSASLCTISSTDFGSTELGHVVEGSAKRHGWCSEAGR